MSSISVKKNVREIAIIWLMAFSAFMVYTSMYGIRKPYTAASFSAFTQFGISYKVVLVTAQVVGYMVSKFIGIQFIAELDRTKRKKYILVLIGIGWLSLLLFALVPFEFKFIFMFINGLPLGMIWGIVFSYLEGRRLTDFLAAFLSVTFIFSSGLAKTIGGILLSFSFISEFWMPFYAGAIFIIPLLFFSQILNRSPNPSEEDKEHRTERKPMNKQERSIFLKEFGKLIFPAVITYALLTIIRDFSEDFAADLWKEAGYVGDSYIFTKMSSITSIIVIAGLALFYRVRKKITAFIGIHIFVFLGLCVCLLSTSLYHSGYISLFSWMLAATTGLYMGYVAKNCLYYERMLATYKIRGNVGFVMYIADAFGYLGTVVVLFVKEYATLTIKWIDFFELVFYIASIVGIILLIITMIGFYKKYNSLIYE
ncbi:MAG: hypothetical protein IM551_04660 [Chitinophagaceae bacterium]|nr:hypothetical protein [Chitinophagaceae bacterium]